VQVAKLHTSRGGGVSDPAKGLIMIDFPPDIAPLEYNGVRYQQDWDSKFEDREFAATYLSATDIKTNELLWLVKLCDCIKFAPGGPSRIGTVDITKITHGPAENELTIHYLGLIPVSCLSRTIAAFRTVLLIFFLCICIEQIEVIAATFNPARSVVQISQLPKCFIHIQNGF
jgi:hypothetical protein